MCRQAKYLPSGMFYYRTGYTSVWYDLHLYILSLKDHNGHIRIMIFWPLEGLKRYFAIKKDVKYHKMVHNFTQGSCSPSCHRVKNMLSYNSSGQSDYFFTFEHHLFYMNLDYFMISDVIFDVTNRSDPSESQMIRILTLP